MKTSTSQKGFSLVEMMVYIAILSIVFSALVTSANSMVKTFGKLKASEEVAHTGTVVLERLTRELRRASSVDYFTSSLSTDPGILTLNTRDWSGNSTTATITLSGGRIMFTEGGTSSPLSASGVTVTNLMFTHLSNTNTEGVLIEFTAKKTGGNATITKEFRTFTVLDG